MREVMGISRVKPSSRAPAHKKHTTPMFVRQEADLATLMKEKDSLFSHVKLSTDLLKDRQMSPQCKLMDKRYRERVHYFVRGAKDKLMPGPYNTLLQKVINE